MHLDHIITLHEGGTDDDDNLAPAHTKCNLKKGKNSSFQNI